MNARIASVVIALALLAGCGGGGGSALPASPQSPRNSLSTLVTFNLKVPPAAKQVQARIRGKNGVLYVSPATLGVGINFASGSSTFTPSQLATPDVTFDVSTCAANCVVNGDGSKTYTLAAPVPPGTYTFEITTWDRAPSAGSFSGSQLSQAIVANQTVTSGSASTTLNFTLNALPSAVSLTAVPAQSHVMPETGGFDVIGNAPVSFIANSTDADGFVITGSGAPSLSLTDSTGTFTTSASGNVFGVRAASSTVTNASVAMVLKATPPCGCSAAAISKSYTFSPTPEMWISQSAGMSVGIWGYPLSGTSYAPGASLDFIPTGTMNNSTLVADGAGNLWVSNNDQIQEFTAGAGSTPPQQGPTTITLPGGASSTVQGTAMDANGLLWVADSSYPALQNSGEVLAYDPNNPSTPKYTLTAGSATSITAPQSIAIAPAVAAIPPALQGSIFVASTYGLDILTVANGVLSDTYTYILDVPQSAVAIGTDGTVWVYDGSNLNAYAITMFGTSPGLTPEASKPAVGMSQMATDPAGNVWLLQSSSGGANSYKLSGCPAACAITAVTSVYPGSAYARGVYITP